MASETLKMVTKSNKPRFLNKSVLITGATSGIGAAVVRAFAGEGALVTFCGREVDLGEKVVAEINKSGGVCRFVPADVRIFSEVENLVATAVRDFGGLDIAFNNAGINHPPNRAGDIPPGEFEDVIATNLTGVFFAMAAELKVMTPRREGCIINTASILSERVSGWMAAYSASKAGVVALSQSAAEDYKPIGIRIYSVSPGPVDTPMFHKALKEIAGDASKYAGGLKPPLLPELVAEAVLKLADTQTAPPTGVNLLLPA